MKKTIGILILVLLIGGISGYFTANWYAQKKAKAEVEKILKKAHLDKDVSYGSLKANIFTKTIKLSDINWTLNKHRELIGKINIKTLTITGKPEELINAKFDKATLIDLNINSPKDLINKPILTVETGSLYFHRKNGVTNSIFKAEHILINKSLFNSTKNKKISEILTNVLNLENPIDLYITTRLNKTNGTFSINQYKIDWKNNLEAMYSLKLSNIDFEGLQKASKGLNSKNPNPIIMLNYLSKLYQIKPKQFTLKITNKGLIDRVESYIAKEDNVTKGNLIKQFSLYLRSTPFRMYFKPIINLAEGKDKDITIKITNNNDLTVGDIFQKMQTAPIYNILKIEVTN